MSAMDYEICLGFGAAYIAKVAAHTTKVSNREYGIMSGDRREIPESEILMLIDWYLDSQKGEFPNGLAFNSQLRKGMRIEMKVVEKGGEE